ncbi:conjugative transposon protein TraN [Sphingobacterium thalpophilum]|uniref:conjugative transposon protein TraN n=1 Tax=Sphingobacterium thalpophilum TaxID=259 RepID=UPI002D7725C1|nr:conjugative transposon protein TraN [Sphingobacterium thalpophilum]
MKKLLVIFSLLVVGIQLNAQEKAGTYREELPDIILDRDISLHIVSPEPIRYVDISTSAVVGDLPETNVLRLKWLPDSAENEYWRSGNLGVVTIIGESFIAQYDLHFFEGAPESGLATAFNILPRHTRPLELSEVGLSHIQMKNLALGLLTKNVHRPVRSTRDYGVGIALNGISTLGDYIFLDVSFTNTSNLSYNVDELRFFIEDKKITKATNAQTVEIKPLWQYQPLSEFKKRHRNVFVLKKATFPGSKVLRVTLTEKQISGRTVNLKIKYGDILKADTF